jgi:D-beta-D-heptose 7-phosphate kinase/D-beta-D-heptose 1-phosphate adenosyltransferase
MISLGMLGRWPWREDVTTPLRAPASGIRPSHVDEARDAARDFRAITRCEAALLTRGEHGMWLSDPNTEGAIRAVARQVSDVTGAADTVVATAALALAAGATPTEVAILANHAAGIAVGRFGPASVTREELIGAVIAAVP